MTTATGAVGMAVRFWISKKNMSVLIPTTRPSLIHALGTGAADLAWEDFLAAYQPLLAVWVRRTQVAESDAEDLLAAIYTHLVPRLRKFVYRPERRFRGWLHRCVQSAIAEFREGQRRLVGMPLDHQQLDMLAYAENLESVSEEFEREFATRLKAANAIAAQVRKKVKRENWDAFYLSYVEGLEIDEVCERLGVSRGTVHIARCRIRTKLAKAAQAVG